MGRRFMTAGTYLLSGAMLGVTAYLFDQGVLTAMTQTIAWVVIFFFASAGASSAYLTVSEIFPMETRALAIAFFYAVGTGLGGIVGPVLFGNLIATKRAGPVAFGYLLGGILMLLAGLVEVFFGIDAEQRSLENISSPLSEVGEAERADDRAKAPPESLQRQTGPAPVPRRWRGASAWAPAPLASTYPPGNPYLAGEVDRLVLALEERSPQSVTELARATSARSWGPGRLRQALRSGVASGRIRRVGHDRYAAGRRLEGPASGTQAPSGG
jgi:MFS family permease